MKAEDMMFNIEKVAFHLGVSPRTVFEWMKSGELKSLKGEDLLRFGDAHEEYGRYCKALVSYYNTILHN